MCDKGGRTEDSCSLVLGQEFTRRGHVGLGGGIDAPGTMTEAWVVESEHLSECSRWHP